MMRAMPATHAMQSADAAWLRMDRPTNLMVINSVLWLAAAPDWERVKDIYRERLLARFPRFSQRPRERGPLAPAVWEEVPDFDPEPHFHRVTLPAPQDQAALQALVGELAAQPLAHDRPLWDVYMVGRCGDGAAIVTRIHHAVADGIALSRVMLSLTGEDPGAAMIADAGGHESGHGRLGPLGAVAGRGRAVAATALSAAATALRDPGTLVGAAARGGHDARALAKLMLPGAESSRALKSEPQVARRVAWSKPYDLWRVKATGRAFDATVNDVLVAAVAGTLDRHISAHGEQADEVHALVPFNLRALDQPVACDLGNHFGLVLLALPLQAGDPVERLDAVKQRMGAIKQSDEGTIAYAILELMGRTPAPVEHLLIDYFTAKGSLVLTNVAGPRRTVTLAGTPVTGVLVWAPSSGSLELSVSIFSYAGKVTVGFLADAALIPEPRELADAFRDELLGYARSARATAHTAA
jgi:diacylglycerol O-acyltransferase